GGRRRGRAATRRSLAQRSSRAAGRRAIGPAHRSDPRARRRGAGRARRARARRSGRASPGPRPGGARAPYGWPATTPGTPVLVEYFGWIFESGRISWTAWATAIADSANPVAISFSLPSKVVMSPHAHTR